MNTLIRIIITSIIGLLMLSCNLGMNFGDGVNGDGNVVLVDRKISSNFNEIKVSRGLELVLTQSNTISLTLEADQNLHPLILTEVEGNVLKIYTSENIRWANAKKIRLAFNNVSAIKATSGSAVSTANTISLDNLKLSTSSGANMALAVAIQNLECKSTSGSELNLNGTTDVLIAKATSGSNINAFNLQSTISRVKATSGARISVSTSKELTASATSGGDIRYSGNPEIINTSDSSSGRIRQN